MKGIFEGAKRFIIAILLFALLGYGSWAYGNIYGVWIALVLILISLAIATRGILYNKQNVIRIKKSLK